ncbi:hypothetical protein GDO81_016714 [Engystomops pustulosus]|uniref:Uncharacterized protein n=1 Tax=Engystomops pustulosus TaxID=76066 RepID=A0AAV7A901_ENGPU|nr:hypothetical protein GDO81_016714 [Engystomops pustulosus]
MTLKGFQCFLNQVSDVFPFLLAVVNAVSGVDVHVFEDVENRENLSVVRHESFSHHLGRDDQVLEDFQGGAYHLSIADIQSIFYGYNELRDDGKNLGSSVLQHVVDSLTCEKFVGMCRLTKAVKEKRQVVVIIQLLNLHLPGYFVSFGIMLKGNREVSSLVKLTESGGLCRSLFVSSCCRGAFHH